MLPGKHGGEEICGWYYSGELVQEGDRLGDLDIDVMIIFKGILIKQEGRVWSEVCGLKGVD